MIFSVFHDIGCHKKRVTTFFTLFSSFLLIYIWGELRRFYTCSFLFYLRLWFLFFRPKRSIFKIFHYIYQMEHFFLLFLRIFKYICWAIWLRLYTCTPSNNPTNILKILKIVKKKYPLYSIWYHENLKFGSFGLKTQKTKP